MSALRVSLKHLILDATYSNGLDDSDPIDSSSIIQSFSETLERLSATGFLYNNKNEGVPLELSSYYLFLTNLSICGSNVSHNLNNLLDRCAALEKLKFHGGTLFTNRYMTNEDSKQKKSVNNMSLDTVFIEGSICEKTGYLLVDMSHTFLKTLNISKLRYGTSNQGMYQDVVISLTLLPQLNDNSLSDENNERKEKEMYSECPMVENH
ncbi:hypothetical protein J3Q64DRAFT_1835107 [Phycomyces blakesleeanus]|uniref:Uncharacterized protein n=1 Tax=Phycomyces blakesleeanus TaxID=4837 RepID=A0ABR3AZL5_PHYBL